MIFIGIPLFALAGYKIGRSISDDEEDRLFGSCVGTTLGVVVGALLFWSIAGAGMDGSWFDWIQILIAPKIFLIEYAAQLAK
jgi:hypothetical protein